MPQPRSAYTKEDTQTKYLLKEGQSKEMLCPPVCSSCTRNHTSGGSKWEDVVIAIWMHACLKDASIESLASHNILKQIKKY